MVMIAINRLEYHNDSENSHKYWECEIHDAPAHVIVRYGRIAGYGRRASVRRTRRNFSSVSQATNFYQRKEREKLRKGYVVTRDGVIQPATETQVKSDWDKPAKKRPKRKSGRGGRTRLGGL